MNVHAPSPSTVEVPHRANSSQLISEAVLEELPSPVKRYLRYSGVIGKPHIRTVSIAYRGQFRMSADKPWMSIAAKQYYTTDPPGFHWIARLGFVGVPLLYGEDTYHAGTGHMVGKIGGLFTLFEGKGSEMDQGTMVRYLQEMAWFPSAYLNPYIRWQAVDDHAADVHYCEGAKVVSGRMYFDDDGRLLTFVAQRYGDFSGTYQLRKWTTPTTEYTLMGGLRIPVDGVGVWQLPEGDLTYVKIRLTQVTYNQPIPDF